MGTLLKSLCLAIVGIHSSILLVTSDIYCSTTHLEELLKVEEDLYDSLRSYVEQETSKLELLKVDARKLRGISASFVAEDESYSHTRTPVLAFGFLRKFKEKWESADDIFSRSSQRHALLQTLANHSHLLPSWDDFDGIRDAIFRLQAVYHLQAAHLAQGLVDGHSAGPFQLSAMDTYLLGRRAYMEADLTRTREWMEATLSLMGTRDYLRGFGETITRVDVLDHLAFANFQLGDWQSSAALYQNIVNANPQDQRAKRNLEQVLHKLNSTSGPAAAKLEPAAAKPATRETEVIRDYAELCRASDLPMDDPLPNLTCRMFSSHPGLLIRPVAMEILSIEPYVVFFHNALSNEEITAVIELAKPKLLRASVNNLQTGEREVAEYRVSKIAWLGDQEDEVIRRINRRAEALTGLTAGTAERMQVNNYGIGGHYEPHYDYAVSSKQAAIVSPATGNRIATLMFYLSDVEAGGATVFVDAGLRVLPKKGGALFWYNLKKSGEGDWETLHAGCPVILGNKWVANKWFHELGQEFRRPCSLDPDE